MPSSCVCQRLLEVQPCSDPDRQSVGRSAVDLRQKIKVGKPIRCVRKHLVAADHGEILLAHAQIRAAHQLRKQNDLLRELGQIQYALHHRFPIQIVITAELCVDPDDHTAFLCLFLHVPGQDQTAHLADIIIRLGAISTQGMPSAASVSCTLRIFVMQTLHRPLR